MRKVLLISLSINMKTVMNEIFAEVHGNRGAEELRVVAYADDIGEKLRAGAN